MMKEFRFEPSSQMIEVQEGQNLKIRITGYRTAYRLVELKCRVKCCILYQDALCKTCVFSWYTSVLKVWRVLLKALSNFITLWLRTLAFSQARGDRAEPRWQDWGETLLWELHVTGTRGGLSSGTWEHWSRDGKQFTCLTSTSFPCPQGQALLFLQIILML